MGVSPVMDGTGLVVTYGFEWRTPRVRLSTMNLRLLFGEDCVDGKGKSYFLSY